MDWMVWQEQRPWVGEPWEIMLEEGEPRLWRALKARPKSVYSFPGQKVIDSFSMVEVVERYFGQGDFSGYGLKANFKDVPRQGNQMTWSD